MPAYVPTTWVDDTTPAVDAANLNHIETGVDAANQAIDDHLADAADAHAASAVTVTPAGLIIATNVQAALEELDAEKIATSARAATNGVASLDGSTLVPVGQLGSGTADGTTFLRGDRTWAVPAGGGGSGSLPGAQARRTTTLSISTGAVTVIPFTSEHATDDWDTDGFHDPAGSNPERFTVPTGLGGRYLCICQVQWQGQSGNSRSILAGRGGVSAAFATPGPRVQYHSSTGTAIYQLLQFECRLVDGDRVQFSGFHDATGALNVVDALASVTRVGD